MVQLRGTAAWPRLAGGWIRGVISCVVVVFTEGFEMGLSKRHLSGRAEPIDFDPAALGAALRAACEEIVFALLMGSARDGHVAAGSDIDLALYLEKPASLRLIGHVQEVTARFAPEVHCDVGFLRNAEPVFRFEALKGRLLFTRDQEVFLHFFSLTCREYESQLVSYARQYSYRMGAA